MIGYNVAKINELISTLSNNYSLIGEKMAAGWSSLSSTLEREWVGPDEVSYETELAKNICGLYASCVDTIHGLNAMLQQLGNNWQQFQVNNVLTGEGSVNTNSLAAVEFMDCKAYDIASVVKAGNPVFTASTNMGLTNGATSGATIKTEFTTYIEGVYDSVKNLYANLSELVGMAFLGNELNTKVNSYIQSIGTALAQLTTCHKSIYEALDKLIANYSSHETAQATDVSGISTDSINFNGENLK